MQAICFAVANFDCKAIYGYLLRDDQKKDHPKVAFFMKVFLLLNGVNVFSLRTFLSVSNSHRDFLTFI